MREAQRYRGTFKNSLFVFYTPERNFNAILEKYVNTILIFFQNAPVFKRKVISSLNTMNYWEKIEIRKGGLKR